MEYFGHTFVFLEKISLVTGRKVEMLLKIPIAFPAITLYIDPA